MSNDDRAKIRRLLEVIYVRDMCVKFDREVFALEFDPCFRMLVPTARFEFPFVEVTGSAAIAKVVVLKDERPFYTDYVGLFRVDGQWKIVSRIFHSHAA